MRSAILFILLISIAPLTFSQTNNEVDFKTATESEQKQILSAFTGSSEIRPGYTINRRWTAEEKRAVRIYLSDLIKRLGLVPNEQSYETRLPEKYNNPETFNGINLYTIIPSTIKSSQFVIIGAHYDTHRETPGADDNASGCALVYGVGKMIGQLETRRKNVILVFLDEEETGHAGSLAFSKWVKDQGLDVHSVHTADEVGGDRDRDRSIELEIPTPYLEALYRKHAKPFGTRVYKTQTTGSDHREFREAGFPAVGITGEFKHGDGNLYHHLPSDTSEKIDYEFLSFTTHLVFKVVEDVLSQ